MASDDGMVCIAHNGEVYNFREIRRILITLGHRFHTRTDTEVILKAYLEWGTGCLERFVGMFAFAVWDKRSGTMFLARDRLGIKPLYYHYKPGLLLFASELKGLMALPSFSRDLDHAALPLLLHYQYIPAPASVFKNTFKLLPGHYAVYDGERLRTESYWKPPTGGSKAVESGRSEDETLAELDDLLTRAVSERLVSDVGLGALLSGGIDSSLIVALLQKTEASPVSTFSIGFHESEYNEAPWARRIGEHLGTEHTEFYISPKEALGVIPRLPEIYDEPFADSSAIPATLVCRLARSRVTVALSGDGGDEQFCGYVRYWSTRAMAAASGRLPSAVRKGLGLALGALPDVWVQNCYLPLRRRLPRRFQVANFPDKWRKLVTLVRKSALEDLYRATICLWPVEEVERLTRSHLESGLFEGAFAESEGRPVLARLMRVDQETYLPDAMLAKVDRASMAAGLEVRVPLLDHRVLEFSAGLPENLKYRNGNGKYLLRKLLARYVPPELFTRPKMGFAVPVGQWLRTELKEMLQDCLAADRLRREGLFDTDLVSGILDEHLSGKQNHQHRLWSLLMWEMWREKWLGA
jgi:asparagine synthase (glutamine-hydrolysing)